MRIGKKRITACLLSAALLLFTSMIPVQASTALEESIKQKQQAISDAQSEKKKIQSNISDIKLMVNQLRSRRRIWKHMWRSWTVSWMIWKIRSKI